jgi:4'-phosphopantetheinyl transferase
MLQNGMSEEWIHPQPWPALADGEAHVWLAHLPAARGSIEQFEKVLSSDERARAAKFHFLEHRERWQMTRGILRLLLARYLDANASDIAFDYGPHGKPHLKHPPRSALHFNASHSGDYAAFALTRAGDVGVDIERVHEDMPRSDEIARRYFAPGEQRQLFALPESERARAFFTLWTRKEAFVKARGTGLFSGLDQFEVALNEPRVLSVMGADTGSLNWSMVALPPVADYAGAIVVRASSCATRFFQWE